MTRRNNDKTEIALPDWAKNLPPEQLGRTVSTAETCKFLHMSRATLYRHVMEGRMPKPIKFGPRSNGWPFIELIQAQARMRAGGGQ